uniref:Uncharacterized protein n=1 Tax=Anguilla anguilla TaxID=7936 RepID=A0A0E9U252_ANGAN
MHLLEMISDILLMQKCSILQNIYGSIYCLRNSLLS